MPDSLVGLFIAFSREVCYLERSEDNLVDNMGISMVVAYTPGCYILLPFVAVLQHYLGVVSPLSIDLVNARSVHPARVTTGTSAGMRNVWGGSLKIRFCTLYLCLPKTGVGASSFDTGRINSLKADSKALQRV